MRLPSSFDRFGPFEPKATGRVSVGGPLRIAKSMTFSALPELAFRNGTGRHGPAVSTRAARDLIDKLAEHP